MGASSLRHFLAQTQRRVRQREMSAAQLHDYGRDGWLAPVCVQLLPSIFLSDERGGRQRTVVRCAAIPPTTVNLPLKVTSLDTADGLGKIAESSLGNAPTNNDTTPHPPSPTSPPPPLCIPPCGRCAHFFILTYSLE